MAGKKKSCNFAAEITNVMRRSLLILILVVLGCAIVYGQEKKKKNRDESESLFEYSKEVVSSNAKFTYAVICNPMIDAADTVGNMLSRAVDEINEVKETGFVVVIGNLTKRGDNESFVIVKNILGRLSAQYYVVPGNMDLNDSESGGTNFRKIFGSERFRVNFNGIMFVGLNTTAYGMTEKGFILPQNALWLKTQLKNMGKKLPIVVFSSNKLGYEETANSWEYTDLLRHYNVQMCIHGGNGIEDEDLDGIIGLKLENLAHGVYTMFNVRGDSMYMSRKEIGGLRKYVRTIAIDAKVYLEGEKRASVEKDKSRDWTYNNSSAIYADPVNNAQFCYFGDDNGIFYCLDMKKGKIKWKYQTSMRIVSTAAIKGDYVIFGSCDKNIYCLDGKTGELIWKIRTKGPVSSDIELRLAMFREGGEKTVVVYRDIVIDADSGDEYPAESMRFRIYDEKLNSGEKKVQKTVSGEVYLMGEMK